MSCVHGECLQVTMVASLDPQRFILLMAQLPEPLSMGPVNNIILCALKTKEKMLQLNDLKLLEEL